MSHVQITNHEHGGHRLIVDGVDLSMHVIAGSLSVQFPEDPNTEPTVTMTVAADTVDLDLPDAVLAAIRVTEAATLAGEQGEA